MASPTIIATIGVSSDITPTPNWNSRASHNLGVSPAIRSHSHTAYGYLIGLLLTLVGIKYNASNTNPFDTQMAILVFFLETAVVYVIALTVTSRVRLEEDTANLSPILKLICHVSGGLGCELLVLILVTPFWLFVIINVLLGLLLVTFFLCLYAFVTLGDGGEEEERGATEMEDVEAGNIRNAN